MPMQATEDKECERTNHLRNKTGVFGSEYQLTNMNEDTANLWKKLSENEEQSNHSFLCLAAENIQKSFVNHSITTLARTCFNMDDFAAYQAAAHT